MRIVVSEFMSVDGVIQAPGGADEDLDGAFANGGWSMPYFDPDIMGAAISDGMNSVEGLLFGRRTWQAMAAAWPERAGDPYADQMNAIKKFVLSATLNPDDLTWNNTELLTSLSEVADLRDQDGGDLMVWGSSQLVAALIVEGLIDELNLMIEPILLGAGKRIFPDDGVARGMKLIKSVTAKTGVQVCTYRFSS